MDQQRQFRLGYHPWIPRLDLCDLLAPGKELGGVDSESIGVKIGS